MNASLLVLALAAALMGEGAREPADVAWAAYLVGKHGVEGFEDELLRHLGELEECPARERHAVRAALLDSLIRSDADVPVDAVFEALGDAAWSSDEVLVLLARDPVANRARLLAMLDDERLKRLWGPTAQLLLTTGAPGMVGRLAREIRVELEVVVVDAGVDVHPGRWWNVGPSRCGRGRSLPGFPPEVRYRVSTRPRGTPRLAGGPLPVHVVRRAATSWYLGGSPTWERTRPYQAIRILCELAEIDRKSQALRAERGVGIAYSDDDQLLRDIRWTVDAIREDHVALLLELTERGWLAEGEWEAFDLEVELVVDDCRTFPRPALPEVTVGQ